MLALFTEETGDSGHSLREAWSLLQAPNSIRPLGHVKVAESQVALYFFNNLYAAFDEQLKVFRN